MVHPNEILRGRLAQSSGQTEEPIAAPAMLRPLLVSEAKQERLQSQTLPLGKPLSENSHRGNVQEVHAPGDNHLTQKNLVVLRAQG